MAKAKPEVRRAAKSKSEPKTIQFSQINVDSTRDFCHRAEEALQPDSVAGLSSSLVMEGQQTPLTIAAAGTKDAQGRQTYTLVSGFRRYHALKEAIRQNLDTQRIHEDMDVDVVEVVQGDEQDAQSFEQDLLVRSISENEQRTNFTMGEKLRIVKRLRDEKVPDPRAASALGISETQHRRFISIVSHPWLHDYVTDNCIGISDAALLIDAARKHKWVDEFKREFDAWVLAQRAKIEAERRELAKVGKKLSGTAAHVRKFIHPKLVRHWLQLIEQHRRFDAAVEFSFGIHIDKQKKTITVPGTNLDIEEMSSGDFEMMIGELEDAVDKFLPLMQQRRVIEQAVDLSEEQKQQERDRIREERRARKEQESEAAAGRPAEDFGEVDSAQPKSIDVEDEEAQAEAED